MGEVLHAAAFASTAVATCCLAADRGRARHAELVASVVMLVAMADAIWTHVLPVVVWVAILLACAMLLSALGRSRSGAGARRSGPTTHTALGCIVMAAGLALMLGGGADVAGDAGHHGGSPQALAVLVLGASAVFAASSFAAARRGRWQRRAEHVAMGSAVAVMGVLALF